MTVDVKRFLYGNDIDKFDKEGNQILNSSSFVNLGPNRLCCQYSEKRRI